MVSAAYHPLEFSRASPVVSSVGPPLAWDIALLSSACFFHFFIAFSATAVYLLASRKLPLSRHPWLYGGLFGVALYIVMNYIVLPISKIGLRPTPPLVSLVNGIAALVFCIGIPLAFIARRYVPQRIP